MQCPKCKNTKTKRLTTTAIVLLATALLLGILMPALHSMRSVSHRKRCGTNMSGLARAMVIYAGVYDEVFPDSSKWCDILIDYRYAYESIFRCKGAPEGPCNYAMNKNIQQLGPYAPRDMVVLFETAPGWNQVGGPEILTTENHNGEGCNIVFNDDWNAKFVRAEDINDLKWTATPEQIRRIHQSQQRVRDANK